MPLDYNKADTIVSMTDVKRQEAAGSARSVALLGSDKPSQAPKSEPKAQQKHDKNLVSAEMKTQDVHTRYQRVFSKVHEAVHAAEQACQKRKEGVESQKAMDALTEEVLTDLIAVIERIRDERKEIIAARNPEEASHAVLLP